MGVLIVDPNADFSASSIGHAGLYTSVSTNLEALHEIRRSASKASNNAVVSKPDGSVIGAPTFSAASANVAPANSVIFGTKPASGGLTIATIAKMKTGGSTNDDIVGSVPGASATQGAAWLNLFNRRMTLSAYTYPYPATPPLPGGSFTNPTVFKDMVAGDDGNWELFIGILETNVSMRLYRAKDATTVTTATVGRDFAFDGPVVFRTCSNASGGAQDEAMFAHWSRVLSPAEMVTFYGEMKSQFALLGLTLQ